MGAARGRVSGDGGCRRAGLCAGAAVPLWGPLSLAQPSLPSPSSRGRKPAFPTPGGLGAVGRAPMGDGRSPVGSAHDVPDRGRSLRTGPLASAGGVRPSGISTADPPLCLRRFPPPVPVWGRWEGVVWRCVGVGEPRSSGATLPRWSPKAFSSDPRGCLVVGGYRDSPPVVAPPKNSRCVCDSSAVAESSLPARAAGRGPPSCPRRARGGLGVARSLFAYRGPRLPSSESGEGPAGPSRRPGVGVPRWLSWLRSGPPACPPRPPDAPRETCVPGGGGSMREKCRCPLPDPSVGAANRRRCSQRGLRRLAVRVASLGDGVPSRRSAERVALPRGPRARCGGSPSRPDGCRLGCPGGLAAVGTDGVRKRRKGWC